MLICTHLSVNRCFQHKDHVKASHASFCSRVLQLGELFKSLYIRESVCLIACSFATWVSLGPSKRCTHLSAQCIAMTKKHQLTDKQKPKKVSRGLVQKKGQFLLCRAGIKQLIVPCHKHSLSSALQDTVGILKVLNRVVCPHSVIWLAGMVRIQICSP